MAGERITLIPGAYHEFTPLSDGSIPSESSIVLCLAQMDKILEVDPKNLTLLAETGAITARIADAAATAGLFYPPDPGSMKISTIGGTITANPGSHLQLEDGIRRRDFNIAVRHPITLLAKAYRAENPR